MNHQITLIHLVQGYTFESKESIEPFLENVEQPGATLQWAMAKGIRFSRFDPLIATQNLTSMKTAIQLQCYIQIGFPQIVMEQGTFIQHSRRSDLITNYTVKVKRYNSICLISPQGDIVKSYQKTFLYEADEHWAEEGPGFCSFNHPSFGQIGFGICMDLNPYRFTAPFDAFEFANHHLEHKSKLILCSMAWLLEKDVTTEWSHDEGKLAEIYGSQDRKPSIETINYWCHRLLPLLEASANQDYTIVIANRTGYEKGSLFCGSSVIIRFENGRPIVQGWLGRGEESVLICEIP